MKIFIVTLGSRGDVQPFVALGRGLLAAGHQVTLATSASFALFIRSHGLGYGYLNNQLMDLMETSEGRQALEDMGGPIGAVKTMARLAKEGNRINRELMSEAWEAAREAQPDLVIYHPKALAGAHIAEKLGVPGIIAVLQPLIVPTSVAPPIGIPLTRLGGWYNRLGYRMVEMGYNSYRGMVNNFRQESLGLGKLPAAANIISEVGGKPVPVLHAFSEAVFPRPSDWPGHAHITGFWFLDQSQGWAPSRELQAFLDAGDAPVYVGFGSMAGRDPQWLSAIVIEALQRAGVRGILATGWGGLTAEQLPETVFKLDQAPHEWLFPRMAAVVHHGGAGTTAAGLRAGRPSIILSFMGDQQFWGERVQALGAGSAPIPQKKLSAPKLAAAIDEVVNNPAVLQNVQAVGERIRQEDGVAKAVRIIEHAVG